MPDITVTDAQQTAIEEIRSDLEQAYIDTYGHIRTQDIIQYLLDTYTLPESRQNPKKDVYEKIATAKFPTLQRVAAEVEDVPGSGIDADTMRGRLLSTLGPKELASQLEEVESEAPDKSPEETATTDSTSIHPETDSDSGSEPESDTGKSNIVDNSVSSSEESGSTGAAANTESVLASANQLLNNHSDKWRQATDGDSRYEVDLPDGTTAQARTKDDIRQLLFKHY